MIKEVKKRLGITTLAIISAFTAFGQPFIEVIPTINLSGKWKFSIGDDSLRSAVNFNDTDWDLINAPDDWENQGYENYNGFAWYRKKIVFPKSEVKSTYYFLCDHIDDVDQTYFNGKLIGSSGKLPPEFETAWNTKRMYPIPSELINLNGENTLAIRVYDNHNRGGITFGEIKIGKIIQYKPSVNLDGKWKFNDNDNPEYKNIEFDDSDWDEHKLPNYWDNQGEQNFDGIAWYRKNFNFEKSLSTKLVLVLGKIDDCDETYINGTLVGSTWTIGEFPYENKANCDDYNQFRAYFFDSSLLKSKNVVSIRINDFRNKGGVYTGPLVILTQDEYVKIWTDYKQTLENFNSIK